MKERELRVRKGGSFFLSGGVLWAALLQSSEKASFKGSLGLRDNGMLDDEGFKS